MPLLSNSLDLDKCPHCSVSSPNLDRAHHLETSDYSGEHRRLWYVYVCKRCGGVVIAAGSVHNHPVLEVFPAGAEVDAALPVPARSYLKQAVDSVHAPAGAVMLCASAVDAMLKQHGYKNGSLYSRIDQAVAAHLITPDVGEWAHEVRLDANDQRHADENASLPSAEDAKRAIDFTIALGQILFVLPARIRRGLKQS